MLDARNVVVLSGGIVRDPETAADGKILKFSIGVDMAGTGTSSGFFDIEMWLTDSPYSTASAIAKVQAGLDGGVLKKGLRVNIVGRLSQQVWEKDGKKNYKVVVVAESIDFYAGASSNSSNGTASVGASSGPSFDASAF